MIKEEEKNRKLYKYHCYTIRNICCDNREEKKQKQLIISFFNLDPYHFLVITNKVRKASIK